MAAKGILGAKLESRCQISGVAPSLMHATRLPKACFSSLKQPSRNQLRLPRCSAAAAAEVPVYKGDLLNKTYYPTGADTAALNKKWFIIDAKGQHLGRLAALAAYYIRGKHLPTYTPSMDMGAYVVVINCEEVQVTGRKFTEKTYFNHTNGRPGSYRIESFRDLQKRIPERIIEHAVHGMLPKGRLGNRIKLHLKVYKGTGHPHESQNPIDITKAISQHPNDMSTVLS